MSDDNYYMDTEQEQKQNSVQSKACVCLKKFFLAIIACGLIALLVFQIILLSAVSDVEAGSVSGTNDVTPTPAAD